MLLNLAKQMTVGNYFVVTRRQEVGIIKIDVEKIDDQAIVRIKDTGIGIDPGIMPRLFEKFASKSYKGTGLGLYICKSIVEAHGGRIWAENNNSHSERAQIPHNIYRVS